MLLALLVAAALQAQDPQGFWKRDTLLGDGGGVRTDLAARGLTTTLAFTGEVISCVSGGLDRDTGTDLLLDWTIDADFQKLLGWTGASARINPMWLAGDGIADDVGDLTKVSNITGRGGVRVFEAWLQQSILDGTCSVRAGILAADQEFVVNSSGFLYYNSVFGGPVFLSANLSWPIYPVGAPGVRVRVDPTPGIYLQAAVYDGKPGDEGFNRSGVRVRWSHSDGVFSIVEGGWSFGEELPGLLKAGAFYHTADFTEFSTGRSVSGLAGAYALYGQKIWQKGPLPGTLEAFVRIGFAQEDQAFITLGADAGVNFTGLLPFRPADVLGLGAIYARVSSDFADAQANPGPWGYEAVLELTYKIAVTPAWSFQPDFQYVMHPGGTNSTPDATVLGIRVDIVF